MADSIYRSPQGEAEFMNLYNGRLAGLTINPCSVMINTRFGQTHILSAGPQEAPPIMLLTGISTGAPRILEWFLPLAKEYRLYAPDPIGQPGLSAQIRMPSRDYNYGKWMVDVLDGLGLEQLPFIGVSFGGGVLLDTAAFAPERISRAALVVPAGITRVPLLQKVIKLFLPCLLYRFFPSRNRLIRAVQPLSAEIDDYSLQVFDATIRHLKLNLVPPGPFDQESLARFTAPTILFLARSDILIPLEAAQRRARKLISNLVALEILEGPHIPSKINRLLNAERIRLFLQASL